jgi:hypothetical protein
MAGPSRHYDVIVDFWEWYRTRRWLVGAAANDPLQAGSLMNLRCYSAKGPVAAFAA